MKRFKRILFLVIVVALVYGVYTANKMLPIATSYVAKEVSSGMFISDRPVDSLLENDVNFNVMKYVGVEVDEDEKSVTANIFGMFKRKAIYRGALGCCLTNGYSVQELKKQSFAKPQFNTIPLNADIDTIRDEIDFDILKSAIDSVFINEERTRAVVVLYKNRLIAERYADGFSKETALLGWSMNKSIVNTMVGVLVKKQMVDIKENNLFDEWSGDKRKSITLNDLMHMSSGLEWNEGYGGVSDVTRMLYTTGDASGYAINKPLQYEPDTKWYYSSGTTNIISRFVRNRIADDKMYHNLPYDEIFKKIGANSFYYEADASGTFVASSFGYATARDWAKFGMLYYNDGVANGERILPEGWVDYTTTAANASEGKYGAQFWLNKNKAMWDAPEDTYCCLGHNGQIVAVVPSKDLVIVRLGLSLKKDFDKGEFISDVVKAVK
jgi:CubicO group peptidase (beta-lactamase class C family)